MILRAIRAFALGTFLAAVGLPYIGNAQQFNPQVVAIASGTTGAVVATMAANAKWQNWICGFDVSGIGPTTATLMSPITVAGTLGGSLIYQGVMQGTAAAPAAPFQVRYNPCLPASAVNTAITVTTTADGNASAVNVQSYGFTTY